MAALLGEGFTGLAGSVAVSEGRPFMTAAGAGLLGPVLTPTTAPVLETRGLGVGLMAWRTVGCSPFARDSRALLDAVWRGKVADPVFERRPLGAGLALKLRLALRSSSSCLRRSSRWAFRRAETASPGNVKVDDVGALVDLAGTKGGLEMEETRFLTGFVVVALTLGAAALDGVGLGFGVV